MRGTYSELSINKAVNRAIGSLSVYYGISELEAGIHSKIQTQEITISRQTVQYLLWRYTSKSLSDIGKMIGNRTHATVLHAKKTVPIIAKSDKKFKAKLQELEIEFQEALGNRMFTYKRVRIKNRHIKKNKNRKFTVATIRG